jgi:integrase
MNTNSWKQVLDGANRRVRGLWLRNGTYAVQTTVLDATTGVKKVKRIPLDAATLPDAKAEMAILLKTISETGTIHGKKGPTFAEYRGHYIKHAGKADKTLYNEDHFLRQWEKFLGAETRITDITATNVLSYRHKGETRQPKPLGHRTINLHVRALRQMLKAAQNEGYIAELPTEGITQLKGIPEEKTLYSKEQLCEMAAEALRTHPRTGEQVADWITLAMYSGGRVSELLKLKWSSVDWTQEQLVFPAKTAKSGESRRVDFNRNLKNYLRGMKAKAKPETHYVFPSFRTDRETTSFKKTLWEIRDALGFGDLAPHSTRHHFISECVMAGIDYLTIARWVGHKDGGILIGKIYGHLNSAHLKEQAAKLT